MSDNLSVKWAGMGDRKTRDYEALRGVLASFPGGATLQQIAARADLPISERTLIRRLAEMVEHGSARKSGKSRAARYFPAGAARSTRDATTPVQGEPIIPLSEAGEDILRLVTRPLTARKPIGYDRSFLDSYRPNVSAYLSTKDKRRLKEISATTIAAEQPAGTHAQRILSRLLIDLSWNSSRLEGNTYSLLDTKRLIEAGEAAEGKSSADAQMILNHKAAIEFLVQSAEDIGFNRYTILNLHGLLADNLLPDPTAAGRVRSIPVSIGMSVYHPSEVPQVLEECLDRLLAKATAIKDPFEQAFFAMVQLPYLQPFEDVNKRVSRLAANIPMVKRNLSPISFVDVPEETYTRGTLGVYELNRVDLLKDVFLWAYERSAARYAAIRQTVGAPDPFRLRHRQALRQVVGDIIRAPMDMTSASDHVERWSAQHMGEQDRSRFIEMVETELMSLQEGRIAQYGVRPSEFATWRAIWEASMRATLPAVRKGK